MPTIPLYPDDLPGHLAPDADCTSPAATHQPSLSWYPHPEGGERAAIIVCPGGGYNHRAAHEGEPVAQRMHQLGLHAAVCHYRHAPWRDPAPWLDLSRAVRLVRHRASEWQVKCNATGTPCVGVLGFSAGGHLAASVMVDHDHGDAEAGDPVDQQSSRPDFGVLCYPVISFGPWRHDGSRIKLLGPDRQPAAEYHRSLEHQVTAAVPPVFCWHTADDAAVPLENSLRFVAACRRHGVPVGLHVFPHGRHGIGLAEDHSDAAVWPDLLGAWLIASGCLPS